MPKYSEKELSNAMLDPDVMNLESSAAWKELCQSISKEWKGWPQNEFYYSGSDIRYNIMCIILCASFCVAAIALGKIVLETNLERVKRCQRMGCCATCGYNVQALALCPECGTKAGNDDACGR